MTILSRVEMWPSELEEHDRATWIARLGRCCDRYLRQMAHISHAKEHEYIGDGARAELARRANLDT